MGVLSQVERRSKFPVTLPNEEVIHIRRMSYGEHSRKDALPAELKASFVLGIITLESDGTQTFTFKDNETDEQFAKRMTMELPFDIADMQAMQTEWMKIEKVPPAKVLEKNSDETSTPG